MIKYELRGDRQDVCLITLARKERANALDADHWGALAVSVRRAAREAARVIVLTGDGRTFCAGGDLNEPDYDALLKNCTDCMQAISSVPVPVIASVNGPAIGAGLELVVACDLRVAGPTARFAIPAAAISRPANPTLIQRITAHAGVGAARAMLLGGDHLAVERAYALGLVDRLGNLSDALDWAQSIAGYAPLVVSYFKKELLVADESGGTRYSQFLNELLGSEDYAEATKAQTEKRPPVYLGR